MAVLKHHGIKRSMSRKGNCWDNAVAESFFATLEHECVRDQIFANPSAATRVVARYTDNFYNPERLHSTLGNVSLVEFEIRSVLHQEAA